MATIKDIARVAGVSFTTVSNVIHGNTKKVSPAKIEAIQKIMEEMNYVPNMGARMLVRNQSNIIGVIANDPSESDSEALQSPFLSEILGTMEKEIRKYGYYMMLCFSNSTKEIEQMLSTWNVAGIITVSFGTKKSRILAEKIRIPAVFTDCYFHHEERYLNVGTEDEKGAYEITSYMLEAGHRDLFFVSDVRHEADDGTFYDVGHMREFGFQRALKDAGITDGTDRMIFCVDEKEKKEEGFREIIRRKDEITGLVFCNDYLAVEAMDYFRHHGIRIPEDFSITGFDDVDMARLASPRLTTVHQGVSEKGRLCVKKLVEKIEGKGDIPENTQLPVKIVIRESVRKL